MAEGKYIIRGGIEGRERLRILSRILRPSTLDFLQRSGLSPGLNCVDLGCGGGDVALDMAVMTGPDGKVTGIDSDISKIDLAKVEAAERGQRNVEFVASEIFSFPFTADIDFAYARFLLTHLPQPRDLLHHLSLNTRAGSRIAIEDIDFHGHFSWPPNAAFSKYVDLYSEVSKKNGGDPYIGPRLPELLGSCGYTDIRMQVVQPAGFEGEVKMMAAITMENIADAVINANLAGPTEIEDILRELNRISVNRTTITSMPRIFQVSGVKA